MRENPLPGPLPLPFVGNIMDRGFDEFVEYTERMQKKYGDIFEIYFGSQKFIMLSKYEYIQNMFDHSLNSKYMRRIPYISGLDELDVAGKGIALNHNVNVWKFNRHFISRALLTPSFSKYSVIWTQNLVEEMMDYWKDGEDDDGNFTTNIVEWSHRFTTDSITHFTTGMRVHTIEAHYNELLLSRNKKPRKSVNDLKDATKFFKSIKTLVIGIYFFIIVPPFIRKYFPFLSNESKKHLQNRDWLFSKIDELIKSRRREIEYTPLNQPLRFDMLTSMLTAYTDRDICEVKYYDEVYTNRPLTDEEVRGNLWETFVAGIDTTANLFTFVVYFLDKYPNVLRKLRDELDLFFKKLGDHRLDLDCLSQLVYTEAIIKEIFRIYTPAPYTARNSTAKDIVAGFVWPEGTQYIINIHGINNNEVYWDEPEKFNPERWFNNKKSEKLMPHVVFGGGRRVCPGRKLSYIELKCMIALIYHKLDIELIVKDTPLTTKFVLIRAFPELNVRIKPRQNNI
ncbi:cytochrome P450 [Rhizophagus irregularis]|nr:cytochrome P450 [Rhizophagus irregularis]